MCNLHSDLRKAAIHNTVSTLPENHMKTKKKFEHGNTPLSEDWAIKRMDGERKRGKKKCARCKPELTVKYKLSTFSFRLSTVEKNACYAPEDPEQSTDNELEIDPDKSEAKEPASSGEVKTSKPHCNDQENA